MTDNNTRVSEFEFPYLTAALTGVGGRIKTYESDFSVEEIPLYEPSGEGTHLYFSLKKTGISTPQAVQVIAENLAVKNSEIGLAGNKDARAVTVQMMSIEHTTPEELSQINDSRLQIEPLALHKNKLRPGHLKANRFKVKIRAYDQSQICSAREIARLLKCNGVPNYYGNQRFGRRGDSAELGECLVKKKLDSFVDIYLGNPRECDPPAVQKARAAFDDGDFELPFEHWPYSYKTRRRALAAYKKSSNPLRVLSVIPKRMRRLFVSAFQSLVFNDVLARRLADINKVFAGDIAVKHDSGGMFEVEDSSQEQARADRFEISPTGPVFGYKTLYTSGQPGGLEEEIFSKYEIDPREIKKVGSLSLNGTRRSLRFKSDELKLEEGDDKHGDYLQITFTAPPGSYATVLLREIMKPLD